MVIKNVINAPVGAGLIVVSSFFYASYGIWTMLMGDYFDGFTASALRSVIVLLLLLPLAIAYRRIEPLNLKKNWPFIVGMLVGSTVTWGPLYYAILNAGVSVSLAVSYASIVLGMFIFGRLIGKEKLTGRKIIAAILGITGIGLLFIPGTATFGWLAIVAAFVSGLSAAANTVFAKHLTYRTTQSTIMLWATSIISNFLMMAIFTKSVHSISFEIEWLYLLLFAVVSLVASWTFMGGLKLTESSTAGLLGLMEIVFAVLFGIVLFNENIQGLTLLGICIIILAAALPYIKSRKKYAAPIPDVM